MIVIFPSGLEIDYTTANFIVTEGTAHRLYKDDTRKDFIAAVPLECIVQSRTYSRSFQNHAIFQSPNQAIDYVIKNIRDQGISTYKLRELKRVLEQFNAKQLMWGENK